MDVSIIEGYVEKVYGYAINHTFSREEADELSQEILFTALRELPKLRDSEKFEPWLWAIASNISKNFRRTAGKERAMYFYEVPEELAYEEDFFDGKEEEYARLRTKIAMLSSIYRKIIVLHYYDGLSTKQIADVLDIPEGTVTWRLSETRKKLKKEYLKMNESALRPICMKIDIYGNGNYDGNLKPFPDVYISDALSQNILYYCYEKAQTVEDLAKLCGVPAFYIEDRITNLLKREAIIEETRGKYRTDFIIWSDKYGKFCMENASKALSPIMDKLIDALKSIAKEAKDIDFYRAQRSESDLFYLYGILAFQHMERRFCTLAYPTIKTKYDGWKWNYIGSTESQKYRRITIGSHYSANLGSRGRCSHQVFSGINGIKFRKMMPDFYINVCEDIIFNGHSDDIETLTNAIGEEYIIRQGSGDFLVTVPCFTSPQKEKFDAIAETYLTPLLPEYSAIIDSFVRAYKKLFPKHLTDDAERMCHGIFTGMYALVAEHAQKTNAIDMPSDNCFCDVMIQR